MSRSSKQRLIEERLKRKSYFDSFSNYTETLDVNFLVLRMLVVVSKNRTNVLTMTSQSLTLSATNRCLLVKV